MEKKKSFNIIGVIVLSIILIVMVAGCGSIVYFNMFKSTNVKKVSLTNQAIYQSFSKDFIKEQNKTDRGYKGELIAKKDIKQDVFLNSKYPGITPYYMLGKKQVYNLNPTDVYDYKGIVVYYNPNVLNQDTLVKYYEDIIKNDGHQEPRNYYLLDVYNKNYGMHFTNDSDDFTVGNFNDKLDLINNGRILKCKVDKGEIKAYYRDKYHHEKRTEFVIQS